MTYPIYHKIKMNNNIVISHVITNWLRQLIIINGQHITVFMNGQKVIDKKDRHKLTDKRIAAYDIIATKKYLMGE